MSSSHDLAPDPPLSADQLVRVSSLTVARVAQIDTVLLSHAMPHWRKVARIVALAMKYRGEESTGIPDVYFAQRVKLLVDRGQLEAQGDLSCMRYSEVRYLHSKDSDEQILTELTKLVTIVESEWRGDLASAALHDPDRQYVESLVVQFLQHPDQWVRSVSATAAGHLARIHRSLTTEQIVPLIRTLLQDPATNGKAQDALDDIETFLGQSPLS